MHWVTSCELWAEGDRDRRVSFAGAGSVERDGVTLLGEESAAGETVHERLV
jgi:hypothetical protein